MWPGSQRHLEILTDRVIGRSWVGLALRIWVIGAIVLANLISTRWFFILILPATTIIAGVALYLFHRR